MTTENNKKLASLSGINPYKMKQEQEIKYLDDKEFEELQEFGGDGGFLQYVLGLESCKTRKDVIDIFKEIFEKGYKSKEKKDLKIIDKYLLTDVQGHPLPECKILFEIKQKIKSK